MKLTVCCETIFEVEIPASEVRRAIYVSNAVTDTVERNLVVGELMSDLVRKYCPMFSEDENAIDPRTEITGVYNPDPSIEDIPEEIFA